ADCGCHTALSRSIALRVVIIFRMTAIDDLGFFVGVGEAIVEGFEGGTVTACAEGGHVEDMIVPDPVGASFVDSLARPGGNATGFTSFEYGLSAKWLELLKEIAPNVTRAGIIRDAALASGPAQFAAIQSMAPSLGIEVSPVNVRDVAEVERAIAAFARAA